MASKKVRKVLDLEQRVQVIRLFEGGKSGRKIAEQFGVCKTQIQSVMKRKPEVLADYDNNVSLERKRKIRKTGNEDVNKLCWEWFQDAIARRFIVTGPLLKEKALKFAQDLENDEFKASNGWLESFRRRHNITFGAMSGESGDVDDTVVSDWKTKLPSILKDYEPCDIFNMDETGLFFKATTKKSLQLKGELCRGGKMSKDRLTVALCASMTGEKLTPLVIGKAAKPRCFKNIDPKALPVIYRHNKKAWMTSTLFEDWLKIVDNQMRRQKRKILLFVDNAPSHPTVKLSNINLRFLPPNTTSKAQPMDQGIIQTFKLKYRKRQLKFTLSEMEKDQTSACTTALLSISVLDAIYWISGSWKETNASTIQKCFAASGFVMPDQPDTQETDSQPDDDTDDDLPLAVFKRSRDIFGCDFSELPDIDKALLTCNVDQRDWDQSAADLLKEDQLSDADDADNEDAASIAEPEPESKITVNDAQEHLAALKKFALQMGRSDILDSIMDIDQTILKMKVSTMVTQTKINDFFKLQ